MIGTINPYRPLAWQIAPWRDKAPVLLLTGSAGGGKSRLAAEKVHGFLKKYPGATGLMLRKNRNSMTNSTVTFMERTVIGGDDQVRHISTKYRFEYANGSALVYGGMADDEQREQIRSIGHAGGVDVIWMEEANRFTEDDYNEALGRLRGTAANWRQIILSTNPDAPTHWIKRRLIDGGQAAVYYSRAADNPNNPSQYLDTLSQLTGVLGKRLSGGLWVQSEGAVYDGFDDSVHVIEPFAVPDDWRRIMVVDFGYTNPFVCQWWAIDNDERMYLYREIYMTRRTVDEHARQIRDLWQGESMEAVVCDHDAEDRATLAANGIYNQAAIKDVSRGIQKVSQRLAKAGDGKPRLFMLRGALVERDRALEASMKPCSTTEEISGYAWATATDGKPAKEEPMKVNDHGMDAMRYAVMYLDSAGVVEYGPNIWK